MKQRRILRLLALVGVLTLIGAACSNDDGGSSGDSGSTGASGGGVDCDTVEFGCVEVASGAPITVGTLLAISGWLFDNNDLTANSQTFIWVVIFFFASSGASAMFLGASGSIAGGQMIALRRPSAGGTYSCM